MGILGLVYISENSIMLADPGLDLVVLFRFFLFINFFHDPPSHIH